MSGALMARNEMLGKNAPPASAGRHQRSAAGPARLPRTGRSSISLRNLGYLALMLLASWAAQDGLAEDTPARFLRGINLNGPSIAIHGQAWLGSDAGAYRLSGQTFSGQSIPLRPHAPEPLATMIRSSCWGGELDLVLGELPEKAYQVCVYVWEDNASATFDLLIDDQVVVERYHSGPAGTWRRLGPWKVPVEEGTLTISARGGDANLSGIELWSSEGSVPELDMIGFNRSPSAEQLAFFEGRIRPLLIDRCYDCHSVAANEAAGGLLLDSFVGLSRGGDTEPAVRPRDPEQSLLIRAVAHTHPSLKMPPDERLTDEEIADLKEWVAIGAPDPRRDDTPAQLKAQQAIDWDRARDFWSLRPLHAPPLPDVPAGWEESLTAIDRWLAPALAERGLRFNVLADRQVWLRRVTYDLTGLPPTPDAINDFLADVSPDAYERVVDRLLASNTYGERWGRYWLDVVRYSDTAGDNSDFPIPQMVKYRDWVLAAFNADLPYDAMVRQQLAGDLLPSESPEQSQQQLIATGYIAGARRFGSRVDDYPQHLTIEDTLDNLGRTFLAMTISCARCHDHKFDPVTIEDYYALYGIFHNTRYPWPGIELDQRQRDLVPLGSPEEVSAVLEERKTGEKRLSAEIKRLKRELTDAEGDRRKELEEALKQTRAAVQRLTKEPLPFDQAYAVIDAGSSEHVAVQLKGDPDKPGDIVPRRFLSVLGGTELPQSATGSGRAELASWITAQNNPLTARVMVNRIWLYHFGRGIVATPNDFGRQGVAPTHPQLLDWLAIRFIESGWSIKALHRQIVLSHVYRQRSGMSGLATEVDPTNELLSAYPRRRLDAEAIRDTLLVLGGSLDSSAGPPHPFPPQPEWNFTQHRPFKAVYDSNHRSVYMMTQRIQRHPYLAIFDGPDPAASTPQRLTSTTPLQALYFLNDPLVHEQASRFAAAVQADADIELRRVELAYLRAFGRRPTTQESEQASQFLAEVRRNFGDAAGVPAGEQQAWAALIRVLLRLNEFVYID